MPLQPCCRATSATWRSQVPPSITASIPCWSGSSIRAASRTLLRAVGEPGGSAARRRFGLPFREPPQPLGSHSLQEVAALVNQGLYSRRGAGFMRRATADSRAGHEGGDNASSSHVLVPIGRAASQPLIQIELGLGIVGAGLGKPAQAWGPENTSPERLREVANMARIQ